MIYDVAFEEGIEDIEESLKWGEPGYTSKNGSTVRIDWKSDESDHYAMYFHCKTKLVGTFKELYPETFTYSGNRAIVFKAGEDIPVKELKHCISLSLRYHLIKKLPFLGA